MAGSRGRRKTSTEPVTAFPAASTKAFGSAVSVAPRRPRTVPPVVALSGSGVTMGAITTFCVAVLPATTVTDSEDGKYAVFA